MPKDKRLPNLFLLELSNYSSGAKVSEDMELTMVDFIPILVSIKTKDSPLDLSFFVIDEGDKFYTLFSDDTKEFHSAIVPTHKKFYEGFAEVFSQFEFTPEAYYKIIKYNIELDDGIFNIFTITLALCFQSKYISNKIKGLIPQNRRGENQSEIDDLKSNEKRVSNLVRSEIFNGMTEILTTLTKGEELTPVKLQRLLVAIEHLSPAESPKSVTRGFIRNLFQKIDEPLISKDFNYIEKYSAFPIFDKSHSISIYHLTYTEFMRGLPIISTKRFFSYIAQKMLLLKFLDEPDREEVLKALSLPVNDIWYDELNVYEKASNKVLQKLYCWLNFRGKNFMLHILEFTPPSAFYFNVTLADERRIILYLEHFRDSKMLEFDQYFLDDLFRDGNKGLTATCVHTSQKIFASILRELNGITMKDGRDVTWVDLVARFKNHKNEFVDAIALRKSGSVKNSVINKGRKILSSISRTKS